MGVRQRRIVVIGGGISGLATSKRILELDPSVDLTLLEAGPRLGGVIRTERRDGFLLEHGPDNFITTLPAGIRLCEKLGFEDELVPTNDAHRRAFVLHRGRLKPIPSGFAIMAPSRAWPILSSSILSPLGKLRLIGEIFARQRTDDQDESLASFVRRRLGRETYDRLVQPLVGGIYTADPEKLSVLATMPRFRQMEKQNGSLVRAMWKQQRGAASADKKASGARYSQFVAPRAGMESFVVALAESLSPSTICVNEPVKNLERPTEGKWQVTVGGESPKVLSADGIVIAIPSRPASRLLHDVDSNLADDLESIEYGSCALASFGFRREQITHPLDGFGVVIPIVERRKILSATFTSTKYPGRAPEGHVLIRTYIGGGCQPDLLEQSDDELLAMALSELTDILEVKGDPVLKHINRNNNAMPQYHVGHLTLAQRIKDRVNQLDGLVLAGNSLQGVGIPQCIQSGEAAGEAVIEQTACSTTPVSATILARSASE